MTHSSNLPAQPTRFIGREEDLARLGAMLSEPSCRLVTLVGPGGIGKTRLATQAAVEIQNAFSQGVHFFNLQPVTSKTLLALALVDGLKLSLYDDPRAQLLHYLQGKACLLVLDNFEHLLDGTDLLEAILDTAPESKLLVTSREVLNLRQEWVWPVTGLPFPDGQSNQPVADYSAVRLFVECAQRVRPDFSLADEAQAVTRICQQVEGMPLAIELAASWLKLLPCAEIANEVQHNLDFLNATYRDIPERHRSMRAVFDHSWKLLSSVEQAVFSRLSVFRGGFLREAAEQVAGASLSELSALVDKSLIWREPNGRYQVHELLRQYADTQLAQESEQIRQAHDAHALYYMNFLGQREPELNSARQRETIWELEAELDNIRAAWRWVAQQADVAALQKGAYAYYCLNDMRGRYQEIIDAATQAIDHLIPLDSNKQRDFTLAILYNVAGGILIRLGRFEEARIAFHKSVRLFHDLNKRPLPGLGTEPLVGLGLLASTTGDYAEAVRLGEEALKRIEVTDKRNLTFAFYVLATATYSQGQYEAAFNYARQSYEITNELGDEWFGSYVLVVMGNVAWAVEDYEQAWRHYQTSYLLKQDFNDLGGMAFALNLMGSIAWTRRDYAEAARLYQQGYDLYREVNDPGGEGTSLFGLGDTAQAQADYATAQRYFQQALDIAARIQWPQLMLTILVGVGDMLLRGGEQSQAVELLTLAAQHPATEPPARKRAQALLARAPDVKTDLAQDLDIVVESLRERLRRQPTPRSAKTQQGLSEPLSERELEILRLLAHGASNQEIAERLTLVVGTVKAHNHNIFGKLGVNNRVQAIARARELDLL
jgi:predicted ATPase/DNA-binding NarL/FixJ family response regulator